AGDEGLARVLGRRRGGWHELGPDHPRRREPQREAAALAGLALDQELGAVPVGDVLDDRQAEPGAAGDARARPVDPVEALVSLGRCSAGMPMPVSTTEIAPRPFWSSHSSVISPPSGVRSEEHTSELQSRENLVCRLLLEKKKQSIKKHSPKTASNVRIISTNSN